MQWEKNPSVVGALAGYCRKACCILMRKVHGIFGVEMRSGNGKQDRGREEPILGHCKISPVERKEAAWEKTGKEGLNKL